jgi:hypothetical protein
LPAFVRPTWAGNVESSVSRFVPLGKPRAHLTESHHERAPTTHHESATDEGFLSTLPPRPCLGDWPARSEGPGARRGLARARGELLSGQLFHVRNGVLLSIDERACRAALEAASSKIVDVLVIGFVV